MSLMPENAPLPKQQPDVTEILPSIEAKEYCSCLVTSGEVALGNLLQYISGTDYVVDYYAQVLGADDSPQPYDLKQTAEYQQYYRVKKFVLRLQDSLQHSFTDDTYQLTLSGNAFMLPGIIPNRGDVIVGDIGNGKLGVFSVDNVTPLTYRDGRIYEISFKQIDYMSAEIEADLDEKTVAEYVFDRAALENNQAPIVPAEDFYKKEEIVSLYRELVSRYLNDFYSYEYSTLLVGGQCSCTTFDYFAVKAFLSVVNTADDPRVGKIDLFNISDFYHHTDLPFWTMLIERNKQIKDQVFQKYKLVSTKEFHPNPTTRSIRFTGIKFALVPKTRRKHVDSCLRREPCTDYSLKTEHYADPQLSSLGDDRWYILGEDFYNNNMSDISPVLEKYVTRLLNGSELTYDELLDFHERVKLLPDVHRYYLQLALLIMIKLETNRACEC